MQYELNIRKKKKKEFDGKPVCNNKNIIKQDHIMIK